MDKKYGVNSAGNYLSDSYFFFCDECERWPSHLLLRESPPSPSFFFLHLYLIRPSSPFAFSFPFFSFLLSLSDTSTPPHSGHSGHSGYSGPIPLLRPTQQPQYQMRPSRADQASTQAVSVPKVTRIVFTALLLDILAFTIILPLFPRLLQFYRDSEHGDQVKQRARHLLMHVACVYAFRP